MNTINDIRYHTKSKQKMPRYYNYINAACNKIEN